MPMFSSGLYLVRSRKYHESNPTNHWFNNYLVFDSVGADYTGWIVFASVLQDFEAKMHYTGSFMDRVTISTYAEDTSPYDADEFISYEAQMEGERDSGGNPLLALEVCWYVAKTVETGRSGKLFFRGALGETDVEFGGRGFNLSNPLGMQAILTSAITSSGLDEYLNGGSAGLALAMGKGVTTPLNHRDVITLSSKGVRTVNMNHRYFNRA